MGSKSYWFCWNISAWSWLLLCFVDFEVIIPQIWRRSRFPLEGTESAECSGSSCISTQCTCSVIPMDLISKNYITITIGFGVLFTFTHLMFDFYQFQLREEGLEVTCFSFDQFWQFCQRLLLLSASAGKL